MPKTHRCSVCGFEIALKEKLTDKDFPQPGNPHPHTNGMRDCYGRIWLPIMSEQGKKNNAR